jgi:peroxiredoxin
MVVNDGVVEQFFIEPGLGDNVDGDPFEVSDAQTLLAYLEGVEVVSE